MPSQKYISVIPFSGILHEMSEMTLDVEDPSTAFPQTFGRLVGMRTEEGKLVSFIPEDIERQEIFQFCRIMDSGILYVEKDPISASPETENVNPKKAATRYYLMYNAQDATFQLPTCDPIENIGNMDSEYTIEVQLRCDGYKRYLQICGKTGGIFSCSFFSLIGKTEDQILVWAQNSKNGFHKAGKAGDPNTQLFEVQFFDALGTPHWITFESVQDILACAVSVRLVRVLETMTEDIH